MKITIDTNTTPHTIEIHGKSTLGELIEFLSKYYPDFTWKDVAVGEKSILQFGLQQTWSPQNLWHSTGGQHSTIGSGTTYTTAHTEGTTAISDLFDAADNFSHPKQ